MNMVRKIDGKAQPVKLNAVSGSSQGGMMSGMSLSSYPKELKEGAESYLVKNYDLLAGEYPASATDLVLVVDTKNRLDFNILKGLGFDTDGKKTIRFEDIVGTELKIVPNDAYYVKTEFGSYLPGTDYEAMYGAEGAITVRITGVVRKNPDVAIGLLGNGVAYSDELSQMVIDTAADSAIVKAQEQSNQNVMTLEELDETSKSQMLSYLGGNATPYMVAVYPVNFEAKDAVVEYLDSYNQGKTEEAQIVYTDLAAAMSNMTSDIMDGITIVLVAFAAVSLVVSLIMICIITYTSVLERTKEIGILRALGARKKDITRVFDAETCILGVFSGVLGIVIAWLLTFPINAILYQLTELQGVAQLQLLHGVILVAVSTILTILGGHIPAKMASRKDAVEALRSE